MIKRHYRFGHANIEITLPQDMTIPTNMSLFETAHRTGSNTANRFDAIYELDFTDDIPSEVAASMARRSSDTMIEKSRVVVFPIDDGQGECRFLRFEGTQLPYAVVTESPAGHFHAVYDRQYADLLQYDTIFNSMLSLERIMLRSDAMILHSAYVDVNGRAILFSGPSGIGKSTQADLWMKHCGAKVLNGDKSLLIRDPDGWYAYGWPICGSSEICHNEARPIRAIVMLRPAKENRCRRMEPFRAMMEILGQITTNTWDREFRMRVMDLTEKLIGEVDVYELFCEVSEGAVKCLEINLKSYCLNLRENQLY